MWAVKTLHIVTGTEDKDGDPKEFGHSTKRAYRREAYAACFARRAKGL